MRGVFRALAMAFAREAGWRLARKLVPHSPPIQLPKRKRKKNKVSAK